MAQLNYPSRIENSTINEVLSADKSFTSLMVKMWVMNTSIPLITSSSSDKVAIRTNCRHIFFRSGRRWSEEFSACVQVHRFESIVQVHKQATETSLNTIFCFCLSSFTANNHINLEWSLSTSVQSVNLHSYWGFEDMWPPTEGGSVDTLVDKKNVPTLDRHL